MTPDPSPAAAAARESHLPSPPRVVAMALAATAAATLVSWLLQSSLGTLIFPPYFAAVFVMGWYGGLGGGLLTSLLSVLAAGYFLLEPRYTFVFSSDDLAKLAAFMAVGWLASALSGSLHSARARAERHAGQAEGLADELRHSAELLQGQAAELQEQAAELELQQAAAQDLAVELEAQVSESESLRREVEDANRQLQTAARTARHASERLAGILETMAEGVLVTDAGGTITFMNAAAVRILELPEGAAGLHLRDAYQPLRPDGTPIPHEERPVVRVLATGRSLAGQELELRRNGRRAVLRLSAAAVRGPDGAVDGVVATFEDVTAAREAEASRRRNEERFRATFEQAAVGIAHVSPEGRWLRVNQRLCDIVGYDRGELLGLRFQDVTHPDDVRADEELAARVAAGTLPTYTIEKRYVRRGGQPVWVSLTVSLAPGTDAEPPYFIAVVEDIQARRAAEAAQRESEARFRSLADTAPVLVWTAGPDGAYDFFNRPWLEFTGRTVQQELGEGWTAGVHPDDLRRRQAVFRQAFQARNPFRLEYRLRRADGEYRWVMDSGVPRVLPDGTFAGYVGSCIDITERREAEEQLRLLADAGNVLASSLDYERTLQQVVRLAVPVLADYCVLDLLEEGAIRRVAVAHCDPARAADGEALLAYPPRLDSASAVAVVMRTGQAILMNDVTGGALDDAATDGAHRAVMDALGPTAFMVVPLRAGERVLGTLLFVTTGSGRRYDEMELARAQELARRAALAIENARLYEAAVEANRAKSDFLAVMSHELRTPLNAILGYADLFLLGIPEPLPAPLVPQVERVRAAGRHLLDLIDEILTFARVEAGQEEVSVEADVTCETLVHDAASLVEPLALEKRIAFHAACADPGMSLATDPRKVRQVLVNLLGNAIKFTDRGSVSLRARPEGDQAVFEVEDTGIGIEAAHLERIFDPFWQVEQSNVRTHGGSGLGLSVARQLARLLGGDVTARSTPGQGSVFTLRLPLRAAA